MRESPSTIRLTLSLGPVVRERAGRGERRLTIETPATSPAALMQWLGIADIAGDLMVVVNHHMLVDDSTPLNDGDQVGLYLPFEGG